MPVVPIKPPKTVEEYQQEFERAAQALRATKPEDKAAIDAALDAYSLARANLEYAKGEAPEPKVKWRYR